MTEDEFVRLTERYTAGQATDEEKRLVDAFFDSQERKQHDPDTLVSEMIWQGIAKSIEQDVSPESKPTTWRSLAVIACSLIVVTVLGYLGYHEYTRNANELVTKTAPFGEKLTVTLMDGSKVFLNSGSSISFPKVFNESVREISLEGEAFFEVTRNTQQPFIVRTGDLVTRVLGTSFNIQAFNEDDIRVSVATGRVQVTQQGQGSQEEPAQTIFLDPSQQVSYQHHRFMVSYVDIEKTIAWKNNTLRFDETPLSTVGATLARWYDVSIIFDNNDIVNCRINGQFKGQRLEEVLRSIRYMYNIEYKITNSNKIVLYGKGCKN